MVPPDAGVQDAEIGNKQPRLCPLDEKKNLLPLHRNELLHKIDSPCKITSYILSNTGRRLWQKQRDFFRFSLHSWLAFEPSPLICLFSICIAPSKRKNHLQSLDDKKKNSRLSSSPSDGFPSLQTSEITLFACPLVSTKQHYRQYSIVTVYLFLQDDGVYKGECRGCESRRVSTRGWGKDVKLADAGTPCAGR